MEKEQTVVSELAYLIAEHLKYRRGVDRYSATMLDRYFALSYTIRDKLIAQWLETQRTHYKKKAKRVYYLSLEFLMGRALTNNVINLKMEEELDTALKDLGYSLNELEECEPDAGLGNGGLGRLAACFLDSLATLEIPSYGYGLRYNYGIFNQTIEYGWQQEYPDDWLKYGSPWEIRRPEMSVIVNFGGRVLATVEHDHLQYQWVETTKVVGVPYDVPIVGYGGATVNTLRLWSAHAEEEFNFNNFNEGDYVDAVNQKIDAENLTKVLYPNDKMSLGKELRLRQQYLFVACSLHDILRRFKKMDQPWSKLSDFAAIQLNDTHPAIAVAELMRILVDIEHLGWDDAWNITVATLAYTNHTLLPEALEKWPVRLFERFLPRHLQIIYQINHNFLSEVAIHFPYDPCKLSNMSIIEEGGEKMIRMAYLAIIGSHSINGVAALHTELLKAHLVHNFAQLYPERFNNKTNGITPRRWLKKGNPGLAHLITETIGDGWICDLSQLKKLANFAKDSVFQQKFMEQKQIAKEQLASYTKKQYNIVLNPDHIFDVQVKRIHEYKRQLLNILHVIVLYNRIKSRSEIIAQPCSFIFAGKAAPGYFMAKLIIKLINNVANVVNRDPEVNQLLQVRFIPNYCVSVAEKIFAAANVSEQISTAGTEASGTGNMKFMLNGAVTLGTLDGANVEILEEVGKDNIFIFGLTADEVIEQRPHYNPRSIYENDSEIRAALDMIFNQYFNYGEDNIFAPLYHLLLEAGDFYMILQDMRSYIDTHKKVITTYTDSKKWSEIAINNIASSGKFSSDRTISDYAREVWNVKPCKINVVHETDRMHVVHEALLKNSDLT